MVNAYYDKDADMGVLKGKRIAVIGYGIQGRAQALNLRDSGADVIVGLRKSGESWKIAESDGFKPASVPDAVKAADIVMMLIPDEVQSDVYASDVSKHLRKGMTLEFGHGFNIHFHRIEPPEGVDVIMVAPKGPGAMVRNTYLQGFGTPSLVAVEKDYSGNAFNVALAIARGIGSTRAGVIRTTFKEETETDNFGEQVVLCGGVAELIGRAFKLLVSSGYQPEVAYFEVLHELKLIVDLIQTGGIENMWDNVSNTAEYGGRTRGSRIIDEHVVANMEKILSEIRDGTFAEEWMNEYYREMPTLRKKRDEAQKEQIEDVGKELRSLFVKKQ
jgi:ketol-acid reductoisomerase